jgi:hypothetical protein
MRLAYISFCLMARADLGAADALQLLILFSEEARALQGAATTELKQDYEPTIQIVWGCD